jgi:hypothetical protein
VEVGPGAQREINAHYVCWSTECNCGQGIVYGL